MPEADIPEGDERWFVQWRSGGDIVLLHNAAGAEPLACPKCRAPVLATGQQFICYACGLTFNSEAGAVVTTLGHHRWGDSDCGRLTPYDDRLAIDDYEGYDPSDVDAQKV